MSVISPPIQAASAEQIEFDSRYITGTEICKRLNISRPTLFFKRKNGGLPKAISLPGNSGWLWEREFIEPIVAKWEETLKERREKLIQSWTGEDAVA